jgi:bifunctional N-acetylglucosamine-1-phosphate-uridyltransferase/glucosamine-1-phosphate-acetyltransferase GlmU-like protein
MKCTALILAAGKGERMKSPVHKVLHKICGKAVIDYILEALTVYAMKARSSPSAMKNSR